MMFFVMVALVSPEQYLEAANSDVNRIVNNYGEEIGSEIVSSSNEFYTDLLGDGAVHDMLGILHDTHTGKSDTLTGAEYKATQFTNRLLRTMKLELYVIILRFHAAMQWFVAMAIFAMVAAIDGLVERKIKLTGYGYTSPALQARMAHLSIAMTGISMAMLYLPVSVPFFWWPMTAVLVAISIRFLTSNIKQVTA